MHSAQRAPLGTERVIYLAKMRNKAVLPKLLFAERSREKTSIVTFLFQVD
jgi:hypothetical protein